jgi:hypothetical protein
MSATSNFTLIPALEIANDPDIVPAECGVYALLMPLGRIAEAGIQTLLDREPASYAFPNHLVLYIGASVESVRRRLRTHVVGESYGSTFRMGLGVLLESALGLNVTTMPGRSYFRFTPETPLTRWVTEHVTAGYHLCDRPYDLEEALLRDDDSLLNVVGRPSTEFTRRMLRLRARYNTRSRR